MEIKYKDLSWPLKVVAVTTWMTIGYYCLMFLLGVFLGLVGYE